MADKFRYIFKPYLLILAGLLGGYTLLHWFLIVNLQLFSIRSEVVNVFIPILLSGMAVWIVLLRRLKMLRLESKRGGWGDFYCLIAWLVVAASTIIMQEYMTAAAGRLTSLHSVAEVLKAPRTRYYTFDTYYVRIDGLGLYNTLSSSGRGGQVTVTNRIVVPLFGSERAAQRLVPKVFWGITQRHTINGRKSQGEKVQEFERFTKECVRNVQADEGVRFDYWERVSEAERKEYVPALIRGLCANAGGIVLEGRTGAFEDRTGHKLAWSLGIAAGGSLVWLVMLLIPSINKKGLNKVRKGRTEADKERVRRNWLAFFQHTPVTCILIGVNVLVFVVMVLAGLGFVSFQSGDVLAWGANCRPYTLHGGWWRLLTHMFVHGGVMHLLLNMYGLLFVGMFFEPQIGWKKFLATYLLAGIAGGVASICFHAQTISVGASGAVFGLYGMWLAYLFWLRSGKASKLLLVNVGIYVGLNLLFGFASSGIDNAAHLGGLVCGFLIGAIYLLGGKRKRGKQT